MFLCVTYIIKNVFKKINIQKIKYSIIIKNIYKKKYRKKYIILDT